jgi:hypothetical protein
VGALIASRLCGLRHEGTSLAISRSIIGESKSVRRKPELSDLAFEILKYLWEHQNAHDTLVGITEWWLIRGRIETMTKKIKRAMDELVARELVQRIPGKTEREPTYRINRGKVRRIRSLIRKGE